MPIDPRLKTIRQADPGTSGIWVHRAGDYVGLTNGTEWRFFNDATWNALSKTRSADELWPLGLTAVQIEGMAERISVLEHQTDGRGTE